MYNVNNHINLKAYDNFEFFNSTIEEENYKREKLKSCEKHIDFITTITNKKKLNFLELGSGNSKVSINLNLNNILNIANNFEISNNRIIFADKWKNQLGYENINNIKDNFLNLKNYNIKNVDICFCVDLAFQFVEPIEENSEFELLKMVYNSLSNNGKLVLELDGCKKIINNSENNKIWEEFNEPDPWVYSLWDCNFNFKNKFLNWKKTYISRDMLKIDFTEILIKIYEKEEIKKLLESVGFNNITFYKNWSMDDFDNDHSEFIVLASK